ncbi:MAG TPA: 16S rRNA (cytosine(1402)-N(4))-methyltransferase RsmH [Pseudomonadales bacterium]|jgi:16S rRNA (cytosine1402-N4)-methyltransferase
MHETVLLAEAVDALMHNTNGIYVDGTFGRGGHSRLILQRLGESGRLLAIDRDAAAVAHANETIEDARFEIERAAFSGIAECVQARGWFGDVDGVLLDIGVSSPQIDEASRGFSFMRSGPLDMRMDDRQPMTAARWLAESSAEDMARVFFEYGEEKFGRRIARAIVERRAEQPLQTTKALADLVAEVCPGYERGQHPATRVFQAIRIAINDELGEIERALKASLECVAIGGRLVVISFHSLEDRIVKRFFRDQARGAQLPRRLPVTGAATSGVRLKLIGGAVKPSAAEIAANPRSRSAVMRVAEKVA